MKFLYEIQCFTTLAECLNFTTAANKLYMSQPGLSKIISNLEKDLNVKLFERNTRNVSLTSAGKYFLSVSRFFIKQCESVSKFAEHDNLFLSGNVVIGIGDFEDNRILPQMILKFSKEHPSCNISILKYRPGELIQAIKKGEVDFGVLISFAIPEQGFDYVVYYPSPLAVVVPPDHRFANREVVRISELKGENFLSISRDSSQAIDQIRSICEMGGFYPKIVQETNSLSTMFMLIASGHGISINFTLHKDSCNYDLRFIKLDLEGKDVNMLPQGAAVVWKKGTLHPAIQPFLSCAEGLTENLEYA